MNNKTIVLIDSGMIKYGTKFAAKSRLGCSNGSEGNIELMTKPQIRETVYDVTAASLRNKLSTIEKLFGKIDEAVICMDVGRSWRSEIPKTPVPQPRDETGTIIELAETIVSSGEYKGSRLVDNEDEMKANGEFNRLYEEIIDEISKMSNIDIVAERTYEADDFLVSIGTTLADEGHRVILLTDDYDITQSVRTVGSGYCFILQWKRGNMNLVVDHQAIENAKFDDIFNPPQWSIETCNAIQAGEVIAAQYMLLEKIVNGDASDDITPLMIRTVNGRNYRTTQKGLQLIYEHLSQKNKEGYVTYDNLYNDDDIKDILTLVHTNVHKQPFSELPEEWQQFYYDKFVENRKLILINRDEITSERWDTCINKFEELNRLQPILDLPTYDVLRRLQLG